MKIIAIDNELHKKITKIKINNDLKSINEVVRLVLNEFEKKG